MKRTYFIIAALLIFMAGCASQGMFPYENTTRVDLTKDNFRIIKANAIGRSHGFSILYIPIVPVEYNAALTHMYQDGGVSEGKAVALANVTKEQTNIDLVLFQLPRLIVRADIIEFTE